MKRVSELRVCCLLADVMLVFAIGAVASADVFAAGTVEWIQGGGFEQGFGDFEVYRYPRFFKNKASPMASRVEYGALSGRYSLLLPGLEKGGYRFVFPEYDLVAGAAYRLTFRVRSPVSVWSGIELISRNKTIERQSVWLKKGDSKADFTLRASPDSRASQDQSGNGYRIVIRIAPRANVLIDDISLTGPARTGTTVNPWVELTPDKLLGIYGIGEAGRMRISSTSGW